jgi:hypothetical protein
VVFVPLLKVHPVLMVIGLVLLNGEGKYPLCALLALVLCVCRYVGVRWLIKICWGEMIN